MRNNAFTLAEVLITLGIIGVVAALTLPSIIQKYRNQVVETRLKHFYSTINQAIARAEADYGDRNLWFEEVGGENKLKWMKKYLLPYMNIIKYETNNEKLGLTSGVPIYYLANGSAFSSINGGNVNRDWVFWPNDPHKCPVNKHENFGVCAFWFFYSPNSVGHFRSKGIEPWGIDKTIEDAYDNCKNTDVRYYCTAYIAKNGWKIPKDYPWKVR